MAAALIGLVFSFLLGLVGGFIGGLVFSISQHKGFPSPYVPEVVKRRGPSLYAVEAKRKPKTPTEKDLWERENGQKIMAEKDD